jgi:hypothetical protein
MTNLRKSVKKILKISTLLGIREGYLLTRNLYGIVEHPNLTLSRIFKQRDFSQGILIFGLPIGLWLGWVLVLLFSRIFIFGHLQFGFLAKASFLASSLFVFVCFLLLGYWTFKVTGKRKEKSGN